MKPVEFHTEAMVELDDAVSFYESRAKGLGLDLLEMIRQGVGKIQRNPHAWPPHRRSGFRKLFAERFPYAIIYMELPSLIWIVAIAHASRRPDYWSKRRR